MNEDEDSSPALPKLALIDADLWVYDVSFAAQRKNEEGEEEILPFSYAKNIIDTRLQEILEKTGTSEYEMYLTGSGNFRNDIATILPYKGNRKQPKPYHYENVRNYLLFAYNAEIVEGIEADDMLSIRQKEEGDNSVIVSRDKDLRMCKGWHYGYPLGVQEEKPLEYIEELGYLTLNKNKLTGGGLRWFYAQCLMGDKTDNIQGIPKCGPVKAFNILDGAENEKDLYERTLAAYQAYYVDEKESYDSLLQNARLVWMVNEVDSEGNPIMWEIPYDL